LSLDRIPAAAFGSAVKIFSRFPDEKFEIVVPPRPSGDDRLGPFLDRFALLFPIFFCWIPITPIFEL